MEINDSRWVEYLSEPDSGYYKGFSIVGSIKERPGEARITFSNGKETIIVTERTKEQCFIMAFNQIDELV